MFAVLLEFPNFDLGLLEVCSAVFGLIHFGVVSMSDDRAALAVPECLCGFIVVVPVTDKGDAAVLLELSGLEPTTDLFAALGLNFGVPISDPRRDRAGVVVPEGNRCDPKTAVELVELPCFGPTGLMTTLFAVLGLNLGVLMSDPRLDRVGVVVPEDFGWVAVAVVPDPAHSLRIFALNAASLHLRAIRVSPWDLRPCGGTVPAICSRDIRLLGPKTVRAVEGPESQEPSGAREVGRMAPVSCLYAGWSAIKFGTSAKFIQYPRSINNCPDKSINIISELYP